MRSKLMICFFLFIVFALLVGLKATDEKQYKVSQLRGKWRMDTRSPRPDQIIDEYIHGTYTVTRLLNGDTVGQLKHWFYLSDSIVTAFDWKQVNARTSGKYIVAQYGEDYLPPYEYPCKVYKILFLSQDSLAMIYVPRKGEVVIGLGPVMFNRISN
ncbi:hypothetical protein [Gabonibacter chumensis]|uniref:hypothetical protein n=1 Tax=Gabonibacter chumensis TaxID=2972474 RepID=UPI00257321AB|nr:hypothetical protein [Gabonibacter chumensis]MCR9011410.1 hypothetical protein [Gabonibacter chumensis]